MSFYVFIFGAWLLFVVIRFRLSHNDKRGAELRKLKQDVRTAEFMGYDAASKEKAYQEEIARQEDWWDNLKFNSVFWTVTAVGTLACLIAAAMWVDEQSTRTASQLWDLISNYGWLVVLGGVLLHWVINRRNGRGRIMRSFG